MLTAEKADKALLDSVADVDKKSRAVEDLLFQPTLADADQKSFRGPLKLFMKMVWLEAEVSTGRADVSGNGDAAPTRPEIEVHDLLKGQLDDARKQFRALYDESIPGFNKAMSEKGLFQLVPVKEVQDEVPPEDEKPEDD